MHVAMDAAALGHPPSGMQQLSRNLLQAMLREDDGARFSLGFVGLPEGLTRLDDLRGPRVRVRALRVPQPAARLRDVLGFGLGGLVAGPADVFLAPNFHLPLVTLARRRVVLVADLAMMAHPELYARPQAWFVRKLAWSVRRADAVVAISAFTKDELRRRLAVPEGKITVVPCAAHDRYREPAPPGPLDFPYVLSVGTLQPRKNYARLIQAFARVDTEAHLVIVGGRGWMDQDVVDLAARTARVHLRTEVEEADLPAIYRSARAFCFPSLYEGFGIPLLEAMASGVPVACSNVTSMPEVAGDAALLFDPLDVDAMADALTRILTDEPLRDRLIAAGRQRARHYSWSASARALLEVLRG